MATNATVTRNGDNTLTAKWVLADGETGNDIGISTYPDKTVQGIGAGSAVLQGSNDGLTWTPLNDISGTAISVTGGSMAVVKENPRYVRPVATGAVTVVILASE